MGTDLPDSQHSQDSSALLWIAQRGKVRFEADWDIKMMFEKWGAELERRGTELPCPASTTPTLSKP